MVGSSTRGGKEAASVDASEGTSSIYSEGERVLAYHGPLIYEAKILKAEVQKKEWKYFVHYLGWSKNWDEWIGTDRLMKFTVANLEKQSKLNKIQNSVKVMKACFPQTRPQPTGEFKGEKQGSKNYGAVASKKKRKLDSGVEDKGGEELHQVMKIPLPGTLKKQLIDDWEFVTHLGKLVKLPRQPTVDDILKEYLELKMKEEDLVDDSLVEILNGLRMYFDKSLPAMLLYKQERAQFLEILPENVTIAPSSIYGAEHLLRLFVKLPELLVYTNMEHDALLQLQQELTDFVKFLQKNQSWFFLSAYDGPKVEIEKAE